VKTILCAEIMVVCMLSAGCATYGGLEKSYGRSYARATSDQTLNPAASRNLRPVTGMPGEAAAQTMEKYTGSFARDPRNPKPNGFGAPAPYGNGGGQDVYGK
jgi:hypothetical protein